MNCLPAHLHPAVGAELNGLITVVHFFFFHSRFLLRWWKTSESEKKKKGDGIKMARRDTSVISYQAPE